MNGLYISYHSQFKYICFNYTHQSVITVFNTGLTSTLVGSFFNATTMESQRSSVLLTSTLATKSKSVGSFFNATTMESQRSSVLLTSTLATESKSTSMKLSTPHELLSSTQTSKQPAKTLASFIPPNSTPTTTATTKHSTTSGSSVSLNNTPPPIQSTKCELVCFEALSSTLGELCQCRQYRKEYRERHSYGCVADFMPFLNEINILRSYSSAIFLSSR